MKAGISAFLSVAMVLLSGCSAILFEGRVADKGKLCTSGRYRIAELVVKPLLGRTKTYQYGLSIVRVVGAMPEETVNAVAVEELPDVFSPEADAIPVRVVVDQGQEDKVSGSWTVTASAFTYGLIPVHLTGGESYRVMVTAFGIAGESDVRLLTGERMDILFPWGLIPVSPEDESDPVFQRSGLALKAYDEYDGAADVFARTLVHSVAKVLMDKEASGAYFTARNDLRPDCGKTSEYDILLDKGLITRDEYEKAIIRYAEQRDPSRVAIDFAKLRDQGVITAEDYRSEVLKAFKAKGTDK